MAGSDLDLIQKMWFGSTDEALEAVQAATTLGFGVSLRNEAVPAEAGPADEEPPAVGEQWILEIYNEVPVAEPADVATP